MCCGTLFLTLVEDEIPFDPERDYSVEEARDLFSKLLRKKVYTARWPLTNEENASCLDVRSVSPDHKGSSHFKSVEDWSEKAGHTNLETGIKRRRARKA